MRIVRLHGAATLCALAALALSAQARDDEPLARPEHFECGYRSPQQWREALEQAIREGRIEDPRNRPRPEIPKFNSSVLRGPNPPAATIDDIFIFEDSAGLLVTPFSTGELLNLMGQAAMQVISQYGDEFDFVGFFVNFVPDHQIGSAFYIGLFNDVTGIGLDPFDQRADFGVFSNRIQGMVMMWRVQAWGPDDTTMLVMAQEFEHRWAMFLSPLADGRQLQGDNAGCGRGAHWNWKVDGQGSGMEIREWIGSNPAVLGGDCAPGGFFFICRNSDTGGVWSYTDLYLMGYVSPAEMDAGNSELRYMNTSDCSSNYNGTITTFSSADIIATNGVRSPDSTTAQKHFRTAWVMIHQPGDPPTQGQLQNAVDIINAWTDEWNFSTLGRGTMDNTLRRPFEISFPSGVPELLSPASPTSFDVQVVNLAGQADLPTARLHYSIDGGPEQTSTLSDQGGGLLLATLPAVPCTSLVDFYITIDSTDGQTVRAPAGTVNFQAVSASALTTVFFDSFETDQGFTVTGNAATGMWERGQPVACGRGDPSSDYDGNGWAYLTENNPNDCNSDVDDGTTRLISPQLSLAGAADGLLRYARWYTNDFGAAPGEDVWQVQIRNVGGAWVDLENTTASSAWVEKTFRISDFVDPQQPFEVRFVASDLGNGSVVEAAVDAFELLAIDCPSCPQDLTGDGQIDLSDLAILLSNFGLPGGPADGDLTGDGMVDLADLADFLPVIGTSCP